MSKNKLDDEMSHDLVLDEATEIHVKAGIEMPYDLRFLNSILNWSSQIVELSGASETENNGIRLALEETLAFLIEAYSEAEKWEIIRIDFAFMSDGVVCFTITNGGPPVHVDKIPEYDPENLNESDLDGLWYFLAKKKVDDLVFKNCGMKGWQVSIRQQLAEPQLDECASAEKVSDDQPRHVFTTRLATADDVAQLVDLTYDTYRYSYPEETFYHESKLIDAIGKGVVDCSIVETDGLIVANSSWSMDPQTPRCCYSGSLMVRRAFRKTRAIVSVMKESGRYMSENKMGVDVFYATMNTDLTGSQKASAIMGFRPSAILLGAGAVVDYRGIADIEAERETFVLCSRLMTPPKLETIYLPERHHSVMRPLLDKLGVSASFSWNSKEFPEGESSYSVSENLLEGSASITFKHIGENWASDLRKRCFEMIDKQVKSVAVLIPSWTQPPSDLEQQMTRLNGLFTGIKTVSSSEYYLVYCLLHCAIDFDRIKLASSLAVDLKEHIKQLYAETFE